MALSAVTAAVEARVKTWTRYPDECALRGFDDLDDDTPADGGAYLRVQYPVSTSRQISTGAPGQNVYRDEGAIRFVLNIDRSRISVLQGLIWIDELAALFRGEVFDGVRTFAPSQPVLDERNDDGPRFGMSFAVPYEHDTLG